MKEIKIKVDCFNLKYTLECGQCFRWKKEENSEYYIGVIKDRAIRIKQDGDYIYVSSDNMDNLEEVISKYLELDIDYSDIEKRIATVDDYVKIALTHTSGMRHLRQDLFETIISYIISANNNIPRISKSVNEISKRYGTKVSFENVDYYLFPTPEQLKNVSVKEYRECGVGFRDKYIYETVKKINEKTIDLDNMNNLTTKELKDVLLSLNGIGPKVADCILLFSCSRQEVFPVDVWVERIMKKLYFKDNEKVSKKDIMKYAIDNFGCDAGIIQQHLFYNVREGVI